MIKKNLPLVELPDEQEVEQHIRSIVAAGLIPRQSFFRYLRVMHARLGFRHLFHDWTEIVYALATGVLLLIGLALGISGDSRLQSNDIYSAIFICSPLLYLVISILFFVRRRHSDTYETEMACKYNVYQLASFRMLAFSLICMMINAALITAASFVFQSFNVLFGLTLSAASLFLFSTVFLYVLLRVHSDTIKVVLLAGWFIANLSFTFLSKALYMQILFAVPTSAYVIAAFLFCALYIQNLKKLTTFQGSEGAV